MKKFAIFGSALTILAIGALVLWSSPRGGAPLPGSASPPQPSPGEAGVAGIETPAAALAFLQTCDRKHADPLLATQACRVLRKANDQAAIVVLLTYIDLHTDSGPTSSVDNVKASIQRKELKQIIHEEYPAFNALLSIGQPSTEAAAVLLASDEPARPLLRSYLLEQLLLNLQSREEAIALVKKQQETKVTASGSSNPHLESALEDLRTMAIDHYQAD